MKMDLTDLVQVILIRTDLGYTENQKAEIAAKGSMGIVMRCFETSKRFLGTYERNSYQLVIMEWLEKFDQQLIVVEIDSEEDLYSYLTCADFCDTPTHVVRLGADQDELAALVVGPYNKDIILDSVGDLLTETQIASIGMNIPE